MKIIIIGAGPGGYETALLAAKRGVEVILIESAHVGGTCLNEGCVPTKTLCRNAEILDELRAAEQFGVRGLSYDFDFSTVRTRKNSVVEQLRSGVEAMLSHRLITLVKGKACFKDANTVQVRLDDSSDPAEYAADFIIIATGSSPAYIPVPGTDLPGVITSKELLDAEEIPHHLCVIGGGVIGLEFASIFRSFGSEVTVVEYCKDILPRFDSDLAKRLRQSLGKRGIDILTQARVTGIECLPDSAMYRISYVRKDKEESVEADKVLMAVGRRANTSSLNLDDIFVRYTAKGIEVNEYMQTNLPHIYAIGDVNGKMMLAHAATFQGRVALDHMMGLRNEIDLSVMPAAVFTSPEAAAVGMTEEECGEKNIPVKCLKSFFRANGKAVAMGNTDGFCKLIVEDSPSSCRLLGCHIYGPHASDLVHEITALMNRKSTLQDLQDIIHVHPTLSEVLQSSSISSIR